VRLLFLNYMNASLATLIRSLELARATSIAGHEVTLGYLHPGFRPPASFRDLLAARRSERLAIRCPPPAAGREGRAGRGGPGKVTEARPSAAGLARHALASLRYVPAEIALIRETRPDAIVARPDHVFSFLFSSRLTRTPLVLDTDGPVEELDAYWGISSRWFRGLDALRARRAGAVLYISTVCGDLWRAKGLPEDRLFKCPNGADPEIFAPLPAEERRGLRRTLDLEGCRVIGFAGNQRRWHGVGDLIRSAVPLLQEDAGLRLLVIGQVEDRGALGLESCPPPLIEERVVFTGPVAYGDMPRFLDAADILAMPYPALDLFHFSPMKMFEGLALGKVLVAPRLGQIAEILGDSKAACLYDPRRPGSLLLALRRALALPPAAGGEGRDLLLREHTWRRRAEVVERACGRAAEKGGTSR